ncbi:XRE family transcriptional regulator [Candidatus Parcubacteria bacterium]|nr:MAG: XRE family transcriptional regulator [Candidatus Parcubacteria bacterium]
MSIADSPEWAKEVRRTRIRLGLSQEELANLLGVKRGKIVNIENGRIKSPQYDLLQKLEELKANMSHYVQRFEEIRATSMRDLIDDWKKRLEIEKDVDLAELLHVAPYSIKRWREGEGRPSTQFIFEYESKVEFMEKYLARTRDNLKREGAVEALSAVQKYFAEQNPPKECKQPFFEALRRAKMQFEDDMLV